MNSVSHAVIGVDPDAFCDPDYFELHDRLTPTRGIVVADFPTSGGSPGFEWKKQVAELALKRQKKLTTSQFSRITSWLERNKIDYQMLPPQADPRFATVDATWNAEWGWPRNAAISLQGNVSAVISGKECEEKWGSNPKWRRLDPTKGIRHCVPEIDEEEQVARVKRNAQALASLVIHPLRFGNTLKMIDPHADFERWHPTLDAILLHARAKTSIELHCSRKIAGGKGSGGPSASFRNAWENWARHQRSGNLASFSVFFWEELSPAVAKLHDRHAIVGAVTSSGSHPFAGVSVGNGWDQAPPNERNLETSFSHMSRKDQKLHWQHYSIDSTAFGRDANEDVQWQKTNFS